MHLELNAKDTDYYDAKNTFVILRFRNILLPVF